MATAFKEIAISNQEFFEEINASNEELRIIINIISDISEKTKVINDIVFQTRLLSFNASVEAARAGEHGKGFAVVAEEIGKLASVSGNSAKEINDILGHATTQVEL
jgi:methyl-accepting chemotaxis protein